MQGEENLLMTVLKSHHLNQILDLNVLLNEVWKKVEGRERITKILSFIKVRNFN